MAIAVEILKDGSQVLYESDDLESYDDLPCVTDPERAPLDLSKVKSWDIETTRTSVEVSYAENHSFTRAYSPGTGIAGAHTVTVSPVTYEHSVYYCYLKFEGQRAKRKFVLDSEIGTKIDQILEDRDFFGKYEPTYHPTKEEIETAIRETYEKNMGCIFIVGMIALIIGVISV